MHFTTLFSIAASAALASAHIVTDGESMGTNEGQDVAVFNVYHQYTDSCPIGSNNTVTMGVRPDDVNQCIVFDQSYASFELLGLENGYSASVYLSDDCSSSTGDVEKPNFEQCYAGNDGDVNEPYLSYKVTTTS